jgi:hypothetical protein
VSPIYQSKLSPELKEILVRLYQNLSQMATNVNLKDTGYYANQRFVNGQLYFPNPTLTSQSTTSPQYRQVFRQVVNFGALPNASTKSVAHGITTTSTVTFTRIYGCSTNPSTEYIPLPYASATGDNIELNADPTNVNITTNSADWIAFTITYVVLEFIIS